MKKIETLYVFLGTDKATDTEGIIIAQQPNGMFMPLIIFDEKNLPEMKIAADGIAQATRKTVTLAKFTSREELEKFVPAPVVRIATGVENA
jgi:hypothetical protein